jgi:hypothetical protein
LPSGLKIIDFLNSLTNVWKWEQPTSIITTFRLLNFEMISKADIHVKTDKTIIPDD